MRFYIALQLSSSLLSYQQRGNRTIQRDASLPTYSLVLLACLCCNLCWKFLSYRKYNLQFFLACEFNVQRTSSKFDVDNSPSSTAKRGYWKVKTQTSAANKESFLSSVGIPGQDL